MAAAFITTTATLNCPHGGKVVIASSNTKVLAGTAVALATDTFTITGCPFQLPTPGGPVAHPCVSVRWVKTNQRCTVGGQATLSSDSAGLCLAADQVPQGSVVISPVQTQASSA